MYLTACLPECSVVQEKKHGLLFGDRKGATVAVAMEWQEWKVVGNHYSYFQSNPNRKFMQLFNVCGRFEWYFLFHKNASGC